MKLDERYNRDSQSSVANFIALVRRTDQNWKRISEALRNTELARQIELANRSANKVISSLSGPNISPNLSKLIRYAADNRWYNTPKTNREPDVTDVDILRSKYEKMLQAKDATIREQDRFISELIDTVTVEEEWCGSSK